MIGKVPPKRGDGGSSFGSLVDYLTGDDKVEAVEVHRVLSVETAVLEMQAVAACNSRCRDPVYHFILSWPEGEVPTVTQAVAAGQHAIQALGFAEHQYVIAYHNDTPNAHIHIALNRVQPETYRAVYPKGDHFLLARASREVELEQGWSHDRGAYQVIELNGESHIVKAHAFPGGVEPQNTRGRALQMEAWSGEQSFHSWVSEAPARALKALLAKEGVSWQDVHQTLARYNLDLRERGSGLVVVDRDEPTSLHAKASQLGRFASKACLEQRLGPFTPAQTLDREAVQSQSQPTEETYKRDPDKRLEARVARFDARERLWEQYKAEARGARRSLFEEKQTAIEKQRASEKDRLARFRATMQQARDQVFRDHPTLDWRVLSSIFALERARQKDILFTTFRAEREQLRARYLNAEHVPAWREWITERASTDDTARSVLRGFRYREQRKHRSEHQAAIEPGENTARTPPIGQDIHGLTWHVVGQGEVSYRWQDGTEAFRDTGAKILVNEAAGGEASIRAALQVAAEKWWGSVTLTGDEAFKLRAARNAVVLGITVANPELQSVLAQYRAERQGPQKEPVQVQVNPEVSTMQDTAPTQKVCHDKVFHPPRANSPEELDAICRIDLVSYLEGRGYQIDQKESTRASIKLRGEDVLIVRRRDDGVYEYFNAGDSHDNGTIIQYVQRRDGLNLGQARKAHRALLGQSFERERESSPLEHQRQVEIDHTEIRRRWMLADVPEGANPYLKECGLDDETIHRYAADIRFDAQGNALFVHRDAQGNITGYEIKGKACAGFAAGGHKSVALFGNREDPGRLVVTKSGIDALSLAQLEQCPSDTLYVSTGGSLAKRTLDAIESLAEKHSKATIELGMDRDAAGEGMRHKIDVLLEGRGGMRIPAHGKDWNDDLRHQRVLNLGLATLRPSRNRQQEIELPKRKRQRDIDLPPF